MSNPDAKMKILLVDDEPAICKLLALQLRDTYEITVAFSGDEGLKKLDNDGPFAVIISDYEMPEMDGPTFLALANKKSPDSVRLILTGNRHFDVAIEAINTGAVFRFVSKPCNAKQLIPILGDATEQFKLRILERDLLTKTLDGSVRLLADVVSTLNPETFGQAAAASALVSDLCNTLNRPDDWEIRLASNFAQIGSIAQGPELAKKLAAGIPLSDPEQERFETLAASGGKLVGGISRLDGVGEMISNQRVDAEESMNKKGESWFLGATILRAAIDYVQFEHQTGSPESAISKMRANSSAYDRAVFEALESVHEARQAAVTSKRMVSDLEAGMLLAADVVDESGHVLADKGRVLGEFQVERIRAFSRSLGGVQEPIEILDCNAKERVEEPVLV